jgi:predicted MPP superfamily phosphohydrolase
MHLVILTFGAIGHVILWVALVNRAHGLGINRRWVDLMTLGCGLMLGLMPVAVAASFAMVLAKPPTPLTISLYTASWIYVFGCAVVCVAASIQRWQWRRDPERQGTLAANHTTRINVQDRVREPLMAPGIASWLGRLPGNESLSFCIQDKELTLPRLSPQHAGLRIVHLTDLHMSGRITRPYFQTIVDEVNLCAADIIAITGDLIERNECLDWIPETLGRLRATGGVYYVLGNHDRRVDQYRLKVELADAGLIYLGGTSRNLTIRDTKLILAGNEIPWYPPAADLSGCPPHDAAGLPLRIVLAHSPDQFDWACANDVDLMLAGHLHGGQVCFPWLGPITAPSLQGVRYASGTFRSGNTVMHVSRGASSFTPLRWNCPPEVAVLTLRSTAGPHQPSP